MHNFHLFIWKRSYFAFFFFLWTVLLDIELLADRVLFCFFNFPPGPQHLDYLILVSSLFLQKVSLNCIIKSLYVMFHFSLVLSRYSLHLWHLTVWLQNAWVKCSVCLSYFSLQFLDLKVSIFQQICQGFSHCFLPIFFPELFFFFLPLRFHLHINCNIWYCPTNLWGPVHLDPDFFLSVLCIG